MLRQRMCMVPFEGEKNGAKIVCIDPEKPEPVL